MTIEKFKEHLEMRNLRQATIDRYMHVVDDFLEYCGKRKPTPDRVKDFLIHKTSTNVSGTYRRFLYCALKSYLRATSPGFEGFDFPMAKAEKPLQPVFTLREMKRLLKVSKSDNMRDYLVIRFLYVSGVRRGEMCGLTTKDFKIKAGVAEVTVRRGKTEPRIIVIDEDTARMIKRYKPGEGGLKHPLEMTEDSINKIVAKYKKKARIRKRRAGPHAIRRACASHMYEEGADIVLIQEILGHSSINQTREYIKVSTKHIRGVVKKYHPLMGDKEG